LVKIKNTTHEFNFGNNLIRLMVTVNTLIWICNDSLIRFQCLDSVQLVLIM